MPEHPDRNTIKQKIVCWDLDETLGFFRDIVSVRNKRGFPDPDDSYTLRKDLIRTLNRMMAEGYRHVVTSSAKLHYTEGVVHAVCLDAYFDHIFGRNTVTDGVWGKKYLPAAEYYGLSPEQAADTMLVIANMASDEPIDVGLVFVHDKRSIEDSALIYETIAQTLWTKGDGSFKRGFDAIFDTGRKTVCLDKDFDFMLVSTEIADSIAVDMGYKVSPCTDGLKIPTIINIHPA